jgi:uncharacterized RDD family membrane protein YckC
MVNGEMVSGKNYVGLGLRFVALIIDGIILGILGYLIGAVTGGTSGAGFELEGGPAFLYYLLSFLYYILMESFMGGTVGKLALGMRVELEDGSPITIGASIIRNLLRIVDFLPFAYILGMIMISTSPLKQRLGDRVAKTVVIKK